jgi:hypothetical protein
MSGVSLPPGVPPGTPAPTPVPGAQGIATGTLVDPSAALLRLATGTILAGTVIGRDEAGRVAIKTDLGVLSLAINAHLPPDSKVSLEIRLAGSRLHAILLAVEIQPEAAKAVTGNAPPIRGAPTPPVEATTAIAGGRIVTAIVIQPATLPQPQMPGPTPGSAPVPQPAIPPQGTPPIASPPGAAGAVPPLTVGAEIRLRIVEIVPPTAGPKPPLLPGQAPVAPEASSPVPIVAGTVKAVTPAGNPVVQMAQGALVLGIKTPVPIGSRIMMEVIAGPPPPAGTSVLSVDALRALALSQDWSALVETAALLTRHEPGQAAPSPLPLPQVGPRLAAGLLNFLAAFGSGDFAAWFGAGAQERLERAGHGDLVGRARQELGQIAQLATDRAGDEWRLLLLPLMDEAGLQKVKLYLRHRSRGGDSADCDETGTRFILEVDLTRLGALQLDGLMQARRFDLMLRSRKPLTAQMRRDITDIFDQARAIGGFAGTMAFATAPAFPVIPPVIPPGSVRRDDGVLV